MFSARLRPPGRTAARPRAKFVAPWGRAAGRAEVVAIGASVGGPDALAAVLAALPAPFPVPLLLVVHMPAHVTGNFAARLAAIAGFPVDEAMPGMDLVPGRAVLASGGAHLEVSRAGGRAVAVLHRGDAELSCRPSVNVLFRSVAAHYGAAAVGVVLTGMGHDGLEGCRALREAGARVLAQDAATSLVWGMPGAVARAGLADRVVPLGEMPDEIALAVGHLRPSALAEALGHG